MIVFTCFFRRSGRRVGDYILMNLGKDFRGMGRYMALGVQMIVTTSVITAIGYWLDRKTGKAPLFLISFFVLGALGGIAVVWRVLQENGSGTGPKSG
ncbi:MAG: AtpZ/AtpI family protein [Verrucomicrobiia bacterium]